MDGLSYWELEEKARSKKKKTGVFVNPASCNKI